MTTQQRLTRSGSDKVIAGVAGGIAQYFGVDPVIVRLIMVALVFAGGVSILLYPVLWLVMPAGNSQQYTLGEGLGEMQRQAQAFGQQASQQVQSAFNMPRFDPQTGQPIGVSSERRNRTLGYVLLGLGTLMLASIFDAAPIMIALLVLAGGFYLLRRSN